MARRGQGNGGAEAADAGTDNGDPHVAAGRRGSMRWVTARW
jgi:hypothetical protein